MQMATLKDRGALSSQSEGKNISMESGSKSWPLPRTAVHPVLNPCHLSGNCIPISLRNPGLLRQPHPLCYCPQSPQLVYSVISATLVFSLVPQFQREAQPSLSLSGSDLSCRKASSCCLRAGEKKCHWLLARGCYDLFFTEQECQAGLLILKPLQGHDHPPEKKLGPRDLSLSTGNQEASLRGAEPLPSLPHTHVNLPSGQSLS